MSTAAASYCRPSARLTSGSPARWAAVSSRPRTSGGSQRPAGSSPGQVAGQRPPASSTTSVASTTSPVRRPSCNPPQNPADSTTFGRYGTLPNSGRPSSQSSARSVRARPTPVSRTSTDSQAGPQNRAQHGAPAKR